MAILFQFLILLCVVVGYHAGCPGVPSNVACVHGNLPPVNDCPSCICKSGCSIIFCNNGYYCYSQPNGAATCCPNQLCQRCAYGYTYVIGTNGCPTCICAPCPEPKCPCICSLGYKLNSNGCKTCDCIDPCENYQCPVGQYCITEDVCSADPFVGLRPKCVKKCGDIMCTLFCKYGFEKDCDGCPICKCRNPCEGVVCPKYHKCVVHEIFCIRSPCPEPYACCENVCYPQQLLIRNGVPVNCNPTDVNSCGLDGNCVVIDDTTGEYGCCVP